MKAFLLKIKNSLLAFWKTYKEESVILPVLFLLFFLVRNIFIKNNPQDAYFSLNSEIETLMLTCFRISLFFAYIWIVFRVMFPPMFKSFHDKVYHQWESLTEEQKLDISVKTIWVITIAVAIMSRL